MDLMDLEAQLADVFANPVEMGEDGVPRMSRKAAEVLARLKTAVQDDQVSKEIRGTLDVLETMAENLSDPDFARGYLEMMSKPVEPNPPIFDAIEDGDIEAIRAALAGWEINQGHGQYGATALYQAMSGFEFSPEVVEFLLDQGADPTRGLTGTGVLHGLGFANLNDVDPVRLAGLVRRCVELGADIEERSDRLLWTPLITAASEWNPVAVEALLLAGADITARAGQVDGVCFAGSDAFAFAEGHDATLAVLTAFANRHAN